MGEWVILIRKCNDKGYIGLIDGQKGKCLLHTQK